MAALVLMTAVAARPVSAQSTAAVAGTVRNALTGAPIANATVRIATEARFSVTDGDGRYRLVTGAGQAEVRVTAVGFAPASRTLSLDRGGALTADFALEPSARPLDEVVSVGTRARDRTVTNSTVPADVLSAQLLESTGMPETWQQLQRLVPSVNAPHIPIGDNHMRPVTLRGLAPHHVLVLVNGKRRHPASVLLAGPSVPGTGLTDLGAIPSSAIERIEVLRDGAAAQYGSDAIGGVVNVIMKTGKRRDLQTSVGQVFTSEGGREFRDGKLFETGGVAGFAFGNGGHLTMSGEVRNRSGTNRAYPDRRPQYFANDPRNDQPPRVSSYMGNGSVESLMLFLSAAAPLNGSTEAYVFAGSADRHAVSPDAFFRRPRDPRTVRAIHPDGFLPLIGSRIRDRSLVGGMRGSLRGWRWDLSSAGGGNATAYHVRNSNNASLGAASPVDFFAGRVESQQWTSNLDVSRDVRLGALPVALAGGAEFRVEKYRIRAGDSASWREGGARILDGPQAGQLAQVGAQGMFGFRPVDEVSPTRNSSALYLEAEARPIPRLLLQLAGRGEHYSDFGSTSDGKIAARTELFRGVALRGSVSTGFRSPSLMQQYASSSQTVFRLINGVNRVLTSRVFPVNTPEAQLLGATPLRPEKSVNSSAGLVVDVPKFPLITADFYQITLDDRIALIGSSDTSIVRLFDENGMRGIGGGSYFSNRRDSRTRGVDVVASHAFLINRTQVFRILAGYNRARTAVTRVAPLPAPLARFETELINRTGDGILENGQPGEKFSLTLNYTAGRIGLNLHNQRSGPTAQLDRTNPEMDQILSARWITDAGVSWQLNRRMRVAVNGTNLFDVYPDEWLDFKDGLAATGVSLQGIFRYPGALSPFGMNGRTLYLRLAFH